MILGLLIQRIDQNKQTSFPTADEFFMNFPPISNAADQIVHCKVSVYFCSEICSTFSSFQTHILSGFTYKNTFSSLGERHGFKYTAIKVIFTTIATNLVIWLTNYNSPLPIRVQASLLPSMCHVVPFSARTLKKAIFFGVDKCGLAWSVLLSTTMHVITVVKICCGLTRHKNTIFSSLTPMTF